MVINKVSLCTINVKYISINNVGFIGQNTTTDTLNMCLIDQRNFKLVSLINLKFRKLDCHQNKPIDE